MRPDQTLALVPDEEFSDGAQGVDCCWGDDLRVVEASPPCPRKGARSVPERNPDERHGPQVDEDSEVMTDDESDDEVVRAVGAQFKKTCARIGKA